MEGIGWYAYEILKRITIAHPEVEFLFLFDRSVDSNFLFSENVTGKKVFPPARRPWLYKWWFHYSIPRLLKKEKVDLFFSPEGYIPLNSTIPLVNVIHDLAFEHFPDHVIKSELTYYRKYFPQYAQQATEVITVSDFSKNDIVEKYKIDPQKVTVIYNGIRSGLEPVSKSSEDQKGTSSPYFIYIGTIHPRKNVENLLRAFELFCKNDQEYELIIVGRIMDKSSEVMNYFRRMFYRKRVKFMGYQEDKKLAQLLSNAQALVYVPLFEGFGLPVIEAFKSGVPVICSNTSSIPEIAGDAALLVDPYSVEDIKVAMSKMVNDQTKSSLIRKGIERAKEFSWDTAAEKTWEVIKRHSG